MLVPSNKLIFWFAVVFVSLALLGGLLPGTALPVTILAIIALLVMGVDGWLGMGKRRDISIEIPALIRLAAGRPAATG